MWCFHGRGLALALSVALEAFGTMSVTGLILGALREERYWEWLAGDL
jgi:hypothetical protein